MQLAWYLYCRWDNNRLITAVPNAATHPEATIALVAPARPGGLKRLGVGRRYGRYLPYSARTIPTA